MFKEAVRCQLNNNNIKLFLYLKKNYITVHCISYSLHMLEEIFASNTKFEDFSQVFIKQNIIQYCM